VIKLIARILANNSCKTRLSLLKKPYMVLWHIITQSVEE